MAKARQQSNTNTAAEGENTKAFEKQMLALAKQLGWFGTARAKTRKVVDTDQLAEQLTRIRDGAADLLAQLDSRRSKAGKTAAPTPPPQAVAADFVHAPGKRHRKPPQTSGSIKHSDERIAKSKAAIINRRLPGRRG